MEKITIHEDFTNLLPGYAPLFEKSSSSSGFFLSLPWLRNLAATACDNNLSLRIYSAVEVNTPTLILPLCHDTRDNPLRPRILRAHANFYTSFFSPLAAGWDQSSRQNLETLIQAIAAETPRWDIIDLHPMAPDSAPYQDLRQALRRAGMAVQEYFCFGNWYLEVAGRSYRDYFDGLPGKLKSTILRKTRQLEKSGRARIEILTDTKDTEQAIAAWEQVYRSSWKQPEAYPGFMPGLIRTCAREGWLRLGLLHIDGQPAAAQLWIVCHGTASIYKLAYDEKFAACSPGTVLTAHMMQHAIDVDRVREVDYLTGDDAYKRDWMSHRRERHGIMAFNLRTAQGMLAAGRHIGGRAAKELGTRIAERFRKIGSANLGLPKRKESCRAPDVAE
ncbi:MAG: GNAT family N-acetyltransferase [Noviherbaspirillum sp.]